MLIKIEPMGLDMKILITGGTGFIGKALTEKLLALDHAVTILSRSPEKVQPLFSANVQVLGSIDEIAPLSHFDVIINLAGAPIFDKRWSEQRKNEIRASRIDLTQHLVRAISRMEVKPRLLISGSAIGFYGNQGDMGLNEDSPAKADFSNSLCQDWEKSALQAEAHGVRVCLMRTGLVLGPGGGILARMLLPFKWGLGGKIGDGQQWMSWVHRDDWINIALAMIENPKMQGPYNATAPNPVRNNEFTRTLADCLNRPALLPIPAWILKFGLGEMSELVLGSQKVLPAKLLKQGFEFKHTDLSEALKHSLT